MIWSGQLTLFLTTTRRKDYCLNERGTVFGILCELLKNNIFSKKLISVSVGRYISMKRVELSISQMSTDLLITKKHNII